MISLRFFRPARARRLPSRRALREDRAMADKKPSRAAKKPAKTTEVKAAKVKAVGAGAAPAGATSSGPLTCPRCGAPMKEFDHLGVTLDGCTGCEGIFFDAGELEEVLQKEYPEAMAAAADFYESQIVLDAGAPGATAPEARKPNVGSFFRTLFQKLRDDAAKR
jgi:Zn-finger nucleic acid-binding protein